MRRKFITWSLTRGPTCMTVPPSTTAVFTWKPRAVIHVLIEGGAYKVDLS